MGDFLKDKREERFCEYVAAGGRDINNSYQAAFRDDCGLEQLDWQTCEKEVNALVKREDVKARIEQIRATIKGAGRLTKEMAEAMFEEKFMEAMKSRGASEKDNLNIARTQMAYFEALKKSKGWDKEVGNDVVNITMSRVFPAGYEAKVGEDKAVKMEIKLGNGKDESVSGVNVRLGEKALEGSRSRRKRESGAGDDDE